MTNSSRTLPIFIKDNAINIPLIFFCYILLFFVLNYFYPAPYFHVDSLEYVLSAKNEQLSGYRPYGYSAILKTLHRINTSPNLVVHLQYIVMALSSLPLLLITRFYFPTHNRWAFPLAIILFIFSPSTIYLSKWMMSDSLFISFIWLWLASLFILLQIKPNTLSFILLLLFHLWLMYWLFYIRHAGIIFPFITAIAFIMRFKWKGLLFIPFCLSLVFLIITDTQSKMKKQFGVETFTGFSGWARANNSIIIYTQKQVSSEDFKTEPSKKIHAYVSKYDIPKDKFFKMSPMWDTPSPLHDYFNLVQQSNPNLTYMQSWTLAGVDFEKYANELILNYPFVYLTEFVVPNIKRIFYHGGIPDFYYFAIHNRLRYFDKIKPWYTIDEKSLLPKNDIFKKYFDVGYVNMMTILKWLFLLVLTFGLVFRLKKPIHLQTIQKRIISLVLLFNLCYLGLLAFVIPIVPRFLSITYGSQIILIYIILSLFDKKELQEVDI